MKPNIAEIRKMVAAATPGPWEVMNLRDVFTSAGATNRAGIKADNNDGWHIADTMCGPTNVNGEEWELRYTERHANAELIAKAPETITALCNEVERQSEENTDLSKRLNQALIERDGARRAAEAYRKENENLSELLDSANNAIEALNKELDYERQENERLRKALELEKSKSGKSPIFGIGESLESIRAFNDREELRRDTPNDPQTNL